MTIEGIGIIITAVISTISLALSFVNYWNGKPKIKISISDKKQDCFFGQTRQGDMNDYACIAGGYINIINNSPVSITINKVILMIEKEKHELILKDNKYWEYIEFYYKDKNEEWTTDGFAVPYGMKGLLLPQKIEAYDAFSCCVLFHNFPALIRKKCKGTLVMDTAIGKIKKRIILYEYDEDRFECEWENVKQFERSLVSARNGQ